MLFLLFLPAVLSAVYWFKCYQNCSTIMALLQKGRSMDYIGECVSQLEHALQTVKLAKLCLGDDDECLVAALLHDIGHMAFSETKWGVVAHDRKGAFFLQEMGFSEKICSLVSSHVAAKRYICTIDPEYYTQLSLASKQTMQLQGGLMTEKECADFESCPHYKEAIYLRYCDDKAKDPTLHLQDDRYLIYSYQSLLFKVLSKNMATSRVKMLVSLLKRVSTHFFSD